ncbi:MAG: PspC domain-containing protein [Bacteroidetes bacterium]|nr:PspC domain-containing protein [Bacteroidota bacterium]
MNRNAEFVRRPENTKIAGVCGAIADYANINATVIRIIFVIAALLFYGMVGIAYIVMIFVIPKKETIPIKIQSTIQEEKKNNTIPNICPLCKSPTNSQLSICEWCGNQLNN